MVQIPKKLQLIYRDQFLMELMGSAAGHACEESFAQKPLYFQQQKRGFMSYIIENHFKHILILRYIPWLCNQNNGTSGRICFGCIQTANVQWLLPNNAFAICCCCHIMSVTTNFTKFFMIIKVINYNFFIKLIMLVVIPIKMILH